MFALSGHFIVLRLRRRGAAHQALHRHCMLADDMSMLG